MKKKKKSNQVVKFMKVE
uniref:Uncharacterized protein n=1 Tax=Rhizophora mucronata TaxID=61149 RepID=A0A2P2IX93_RHIMU